MMQDIAQIMVLFFIYYVLNYYFGKDLYNQEIFQSLIAIIPIIIFKIIKLVLSFIKRPLNMKIDMFDYLSKKNQCITISHFSLKQEKERKFSIKITLDKNLSLWNKFAIKLAKNKNLFLRVEMQPAYSQFILTSSNAGIPINKVDRGIYEINISSMVQSALMANEQFFQIIDFIVNENRDNAPTNSLNFVVKGYILIEGKKYEEMNILERFMISVKDADNSNFKVEYYI